MNSSFALEIKITPVTDAASYEAALQRVSYLMEQSPTEGSVEYAELDVLATLLVAYEKINYPVLPPDPVAAIQFRAEQMGLQRKDLEPYIGSRGRVTEILNRTRPLTVTMMRRLHDALGIPFETLAREYPTKDKMPAVSTVVSVPTGVFAVGRRNREARKNRTQAMTGRSVAVQEEA